MKRHIIWIKISSIALLILGFIHLVASIIVIPMFQNLGAQQFSVFLFMYLAAGVGTILPAVIILLHIKELRGDNSKSLVTIYICSGYTVLLGIGAIILMVDNPFSYLTFILGAFLLISTLLLKRQKID